MTKPADVLSIRALWPPALVFAIYVFACLMGVTTKLLWIDMVFHFFGGLAVACCISRTVDVLNARDMAGSLSGILREAFVLSMTASVALLWEFGEFVVDSALAVRFQDDLTDTMSDLALGVVGGIVYLISLRLLRSRARH